jgi:hypothetical protein
MQLAQALSLNAEAHARWCQEHGIPAAPITPIAKGIVQQTACPQQDPATAPFTFFTRSDQEQVMVNRSCLVNYDGMNFIEHVELLLLLMWDAFPCLAPSTGVVLCLACQSCKTMETPCKLRSQLFSMTQPPR